MVNLSNESYRIEPGERIAQLVLAKTEKAELEATEVIVNTDRGGTGFGDSGRF